MTSRLRPAQEVLYAGASSASVAFEVVRRRVQWTTRTAEAWESPRSPYMLTAFPYPPFGTLAVTSAVLSCRFLRASSDTYRCRVSRWLCQSPSILCFHSWCPWS